MSTYVQLARQQGREEGRQEGRAEGRQEGRAEGRQEGRAEGRHEGRREGETLVLLRQIRLRFGEIPETIRERIEQADADTLLAWSERILTAERIADVVR